MSRTREPLTFTVASLQASDAFASFSKGAHPRRLVGVVGLEVPLAARVALVGSIIYGRSRSR